MHGDFQCERINKFEKKMNLLLHKKDGCCKNDKKNYCNNKTSHKNKNSISGCSMHLIVGNSYYKKYRMKMYYTDTVIQLRKVNLIMLCHNYNRIKKTIKKTLLH